MLSLLVAGGGLVWNESRWRAERKSDVRVMAWHDGMGMDIYGSDAVEDEHAIALRVVNHGERPEHVMWIGVESPAGEPLADDRPKAGKMIDDPPPEARELPPRGQIATTFKLSASAIADGFVGYVMLGTGKRVESVPTTPDPGLAEMQADIQRIVEEELGDSGP